MGEEPDGKHTLPEDYGALYLQWATALHKVDPSLKLGGPIFEGVNKDIEVWPDARGRTSWMGRFFDYLREHNRLNDLSFISFEHYPFEPCKLQWSDLYDEANLTRHILQVWREDGLPPGIPMFITETNIAAGSDESFVDTFAALWWAILGISSISMVAPARALGSAQDTIKSIRGKHPKTNTKPTKSETESFS